MGKLCLFDATFETNARARRINCKYSYFANLPRNVSIFWNWALNWSKRITNYMYIASKELKNYHYSFKPKDLSNHLFKIPMTQIDQNRLHSYARQKNLENMQDFSDFLNIWFKQPTDLTWFLFHSACFSHSENINSLFAYLKWWGKYTGTTS